MIFFNVIMGIIGTFQIFTEPFIMTKGGPAYATHFLPQMIYESAFRDLHMGYASALAWILFMIILGLTALAFRASSRRGLRPFWIGVIAAGSVLAGKFWLDSERITYAGVGLLS